MITDFHPLFSANQSKWRLYADAYEAGPTYPSRVNPITGLTHVSRYHLESVQTYTDRLKKAVPVELCSPAVDLLAGSIDGISISVPDSLQVLVDDADLQGTSLVQLLADARSKAAIYGHCFLLIDSTRPDTEIRTQADVLAAGVRPFVRILTPLQVTNWRLGQAGQLEEVVYRVVPEPSTSIADAASEPVEQIRYWSRTEWRIYEHRSGSDVLISSGPNPTGVVPVSILYHRRIQSMLGDSLLKSAAGYQEQLTRWLSDLDLVQTMQSHSQPVLRSNAKPTEIGFGSAVVLHLAPGRKEGDVTFDSESFEYVSPDPAPLELAWASFFRVFGLAMKSMALPGESIEGNPAAPQSGVAKSYDWRQTDKRLQTMSLNEQEAVRQALFIACLWSGASFDQVQVQYPTSFDLSSLQDSVDQLIALMSAGAPPSARRELMRACISKALPNMDPETQAAIYEDLKNMGVVDARIQQMTQAA